jgi:hypothetical protein
MSTVYGNWHIVVVALAKLVPHGVGPLELSDATLFSFFFKYIMAMHAYRIINAISSGLVMQKTKTFRAQQN